MWALCICNSDCTAPSQCLLETRVKWQMFPFPRLSRMSCSFRRHLLCSVHIKCLPIWKPLWVFKEAQRTDTQVRVKLRQKQRRRRVDHFFRAQGGAGGPGLIWGSIESHLLIQFQMTQLGSLTPDQMKRRRKWKWAFKRLSTPSSVFLSHTNRQVSLVSDMVTMSAHYVGTLTLIWEHFHGVPQGSVLAPF